MDDENLRSICRKTQASRRIGFTSSEFQENLDGDFKSSVDEMAIEKIKSDIEGRCIGEGYVIPNTIKLIKRGGISFPHEALQLHYSIQVSYEFMLCNPNPGAILKCKVVTKNKIGILGRLNNDKSPLVILIPRDLCDTKEKMDILLASNKGDDIKIVVIGKKFEQNDKKITVIAEIAIE
jgi:DNA-directed RNA polymerase subunit E'/Rpb7